jgi:hypothetical protein
MIQPGKTDRKTRTRKSEPWAVRLNKPDPRRDPEAMGTRIYRPAYATGLWRLNHEGLIPEGVTTPTFATIRDATTIATNIGPIEYWQIPRKAFFGYKIQDGAYIATPEKALLDFFWLRNIEWNEKEFERWRIQDDWKCLNWDRLRDYLKKWGDPRLERAVDALAAFLG